MLRNKIYLMFVLMLLCVFIISISAAGVSINPRIDDHTAKNKIHPKIESGILEEKQGQKSAFAAQVQDQSTKRVVFELKDSDKSRIRYLEDSGAVVEAVHEDLVQASVPVSQLQAMSDLPFVNYIRSPRRPFKDAISEGVGVINATPIQNLGVRGRGVKIAVIDVGFADYESKLGTELPGNVTVKSYTGDITGGGEKHGTAVAEIIYDIAPDAQLYLINIGSDVEFLNATDYAMSQNVDIISMSLGWLDGPYDGTSTISEKVNGAVSGGIVWVNSAGNYAQKHWQGKFNDTDNNKINDFTPLDEHMSINLFSTCPPNVCNNFVIFLSWDNWPASDQDYDLYLYNSTGNEIKASKTAQDGTQKPFEKIEMNNLAPGTYNLQIKKFNATRNVNFELYSAYQDIEAKHQVPSSSLDIPGDAQGAITVGATNYLNDNLELFSSQGPTDDGRTKPDIVAPDGVQTSLPSPFSPFYGTSASAPHAAGVAALLKSINSSLTPDQIRSALQSTAKSLGDPNSYGSGRIDAWKAAIMVDKQPPVITIESPINGKILNNSNIDVTGTASDNLGLNKIEVNIGNGSWQTASGNTSWRKTMTISQGVNTIYARANDTAGNIQITSVDVTLDTTIPTIIIGLPTEGTIFNKSVITVAGTASDNYLNEVEVRINNEIREIANGTTSWDISIKLSEGKNTVYAKAIDSAGNFKETSVNVTLDTTPPVWSPIPTNQTVQVGRSFSYDVNATNASIYSINDTTNFTIDPVSGYITNATGLSIGIYGLNITATDAFGNSESKIITITVQPEPTYSISGYVFDNNNAGLVGVNIQNGTYQGTSDAAGYYVLSGQVNGSYNFSYSKAGFNINYSVINVTGSDLANKNETLYDTTPPDQVNGLVNDIPTRTNVNLSWNTTANANHYQVFRNSSLRGTTQNTYWNETGLVPDTLYQYWVRANDSYNNWGQNSSILSVRTAPPPIIITIVSPAEINSVNTTGFIDVIVDLNRTATVFLNWDGLNESMGEGTHFHKNKTGLLSGNYSFRVYANDSNGDSNASELRIVSVNRTIIDNKIRNSINTSTFIVNTTLEIASPSGNTTLIIPNGTNASIAGAPVISISIDSVAKINSSFAALAGNDKFIGENVTFGPSGAVFDPPIQIRFNYSDTQISAAGISESDLSVKYYNTISNNWETLTIFQRYPAENYLIANISHFSTVALVGTTVVVNTPPPSSGGGGGGGGGISGENFTNIMVKEKYDLHIYKDIVTSYKFTNINNPIVSINIVSNVNAGEIGTVVEVLKNKSSLVKTPAPGTVYKNVNVWVGTSGFGSPKNIKEAVITFRVSNSWISGNNIDSSGIKMVRWDGSTWNQLETSEKKDDGAFTYYEAKTNAFSSFAITQLEAAGSKALPQGTAQSGIPANVTDSAPAKATSEGAQPVNFAIIIVVLAVIGTVVAVYLKKRGNFKK